jgi:hypothetical protein
MQAAADPCAMHAVTLRSILNDDADRRHPLSR